MRVTSRPFAIAETSFFVSRFAVSEVAWPLVALDDERVFSFHGIILPQSAVFAPKFLRQRYWRDKAADADCWGERGGRGERAAKTTKVMHDMNRWWYNDSMIGGNKVRIPAVLAFAIWPTVMLFYSLYAFPALVTSWLICRHFLTRHDPQK